MSFGPTKKDIAFGDLKLWAHGRVAAGAGHVPCNKMPSMDVRLIIAQAEDCFSKPNLESCFPVVLQHDERVDELHRMVLSASPEVLNTVRETMRKYPVVQR